MIRISLMACAVTLPLALCVPVLHAQSTDPEAAKGASLMPESGPAVVGGTGATAGPNHKNQAIVPMPGLRQEELSERPPVISPPVPDVRPSVSVPPPNARR
jgi:hypothetical protein